MKQVININFQGRVVPIEVTAFELLKNYTESLNRYFADEEGKEEIINDIESRIGELFQQRIKEGATCITDDDVNAIISSMGRPEDFDAEEGTQTAGAEKQEKQTDNSQYQSSTFTSAGNRLYRDENNKVLGGVCSGLGNYFNIDPVIVRIIFIVTFGVAFLPYLILWAAVPGSSSGAIGGTRKKLYRNGDDKIIGGVCSGIGNYLGINSWIPRVLFLLPFLSYIFRWGHWGFNDFPDFLRIGFSPGALIIYIILWLVIPEAATTAEKLQMKGEKVDIDSIKHSVMEEMKGVQERARKFGKEAAGFTQEKGKAMGAELGTVAKRGGRSLGDIIVFLLKLFAYFVVGCVGIGLVIGLFVIGVVSIGYFPVKDFIISTDWQNTYAWGTLLFFIGVPIIGIITWIIRKLVKSKANSKLLTLTFTSLWILGWIFAMLLVSSIHRDLKFSSKNISEEEIILTDPTVNKLELTSLSPLEKYSNRHFLKLEPFEGLYDDTVYLNNIDIRIVKSPNDSFRVTVIKFANGRSRSTAENSASIIKYGGVQYDSILKLDRGIAINKTEKFRNQRIVLTVYVPAGKNIKIDRSVSWFNHVYIGSPWDGNEWDYYDDSNKWSENTEYKMGADGKLYKLNGEPAERSGRTRIRINDDGFEMVTDNDNNYRYNNAPPLNNLDSLKMKLRLEESKMKDSLRREKDKIERQLEKINNNDEDPAPLSYYPIPMYGPQTYIN